MVKGRFAENERNYIKSVRNYTLELKMKAAQAEMQCWKGSALRMAPLKDVHMFCNVCVMICSLILQVAAHCPKWQGPESGRHLRVSNRLPIHPVTVGVSPVADPNRSDCNLIPQSEPWASGEPV